MKWRCRLLVALAFVANATHADEPEPVPAPAAAPVDDPAAEVGPPAVAPERWLIVHEQSVASFRVRVLGVLPIGGEFARFNGAIVLDRARERAHVEAVIQSGSVTMANPSHAAWARSAEFFDADRHREIRFTSRALPFATIASGGTLRGRLSLRGITRDVAFQFQSDGCDLAHATRCTVSVFGSVDRTLFGMTTRTRTLNDRVSLRFTIATAPARQPT